MRLALKRLDRVAGSEFSVPLSRLVLRNAEQNPIFDKTVEEYRELIRQGQTLRTIEVNLCGPDGNEVGQDTNNGKYIDGRRVKPTDQYYEVNDGHHRALAALAEGLSSLQATRIDILSPDEVRNYGNPYYLPVETEGHKEGSAKFHLTARASIPDVYDVAQPFAVKITQLIENLKSEYNIKGSTPEADKKVRQAAYATQRIFGTENIPAPKLLRTEDAKDMWKGMRLELSDSGRHGEGADGATFYSSVQLIVLDIFTHFFVQRKEKTYNELLSLLTHELRHAADWAYTGSLPATINDPESYDDGNPTSVYQELRGNNRPLSKQFEGTESWWRVYLNTPTELMAWAGQIADEFKRYPTSGTQLTEIVQRRRVNVVADAEVLPARKLFEANSAKRQRKSVSPNQSFAEAWPAIERTLPRTKVPILELIAPENRRRFFEMLTKALDIRQERKQTQLRE